MGLRALLAINPGNIPRMSANGSSVTLDWRVLVFMIAVSLLTGILFGLIPAFHSSRSDLHAALKESGAWSGSASRENKSRSILVISEMALALVLLAGAALLIRTLIAMHTVNPGFDPHNVLTMRMALTGPQYAIGAQIVVGKSAGPAFNDEPPREIVGIVGDVREYGLNYHPPPMIYVPLAQVTDGATSLIETVFPVWWAIRTRVPPFPLSREIGRRLREASGGLPVAQIESMDQLVAASTAQADFNMTLLTVFASVALLLAAVGIYGVIAYSVQQRTQEIGIRMALGATPQGVRIMVVRQGMTLAVIGVGIGTVAAFGLTRLIAKMLYGVKASNPAVFVSVAVLLTLVALLACYIPARRAAKVDPMVALRHE